MNKRIEEIYTKCSYERPEFVMDYINYKKFAQLIIEECAKVAADHDALDIYEDIMDHFYDAPLRSE
jgi:hypothetical protein